MVCCQRQSYFMFITMDQYVGPLSKYLSIGPYYSVQVSLHFAAGFAFTSFTLYCIFIRAIYVNIDHVNIVVYMV